jgi:hypothetical protein
MIRIINSSLKAVKFPLLKASASAAIGAHHSLILSQDALYAIGSNGSFRSA